MIDQTSDISISFITVIAACIAAGITGLFSLVGLIISKEQRVSDFRQIWIDALRIDIAKFAAHAHQIHAYITIKKPSTKDEYDKYLNETREDFIELNQASMRIKLRLNPNECDSRLILQSMADMENLFDSLKELPDSTALSNIFSIVSSLERNSPPLLKKEWNRVKRGEIYFQISKWSALTLFILASILVYSLWHYLISHH